MGCKCLNYNNDEYEVISRETCKENTAVNNNDNNLIDIVNNNNEKMNNQDSNINLLIITVVIMKAVKIKMNMKRMKITIQNI